VSISHFNIGSLTQTIIWTGDGRRCLAGCLASSVYGALQGNVCL